MKTSTNKFLGFILLLTVLIGTRFANAQSCPSNKVWACRNDACGVQECKCIKASQVQAWMAVIPPCNNNWWHPNCCDGFRMSGNSAGIGINNVFPNPVANSATVVFSVEETQNISLRIFDMNGKLISTIADKNFDEGKYELVWNTGNIYSGIYFLEFRSTDKMERIKISVQK
jgi:hypothetical protein